jgi:hypothetical protein
MRWHARYLLPRSLRLALTGFGAVSCLVATIIALTQLLSVTAASFMTTMPPANLPACSSLMHAYGNLAQALKFHDEAPQYGTVAINALGCLLFGTLFFVDRRAADDRVVRREKVRSADPSSKLLPSCMQQLHSATRE